MGEHHLGLSTKIARDTEMLSAFKAGDYAMLVCDHPAQVSAAYCVYLEKAQPVIDPNTIDFEHEEELTDAACTKAHGFVVTTPSHVVVMKGL